VAVALLPVVCVCVSRRTRQRAPLTMSADRVQVPTAAEIAAIDADLQQPQFAGVAEFVVGFHRSCSCTRAAQQIGGHTCGSNDQTLAELGAWARQYYTALWIANTRIPRSSTTPVRESRGVPRRTSCRMICSTAGPAMTIDRKSLAFGATAGSGAFVNQTGAQRSGSPRQARGCALDGRIERAVADVSPIYRYRFLRPCRVFGVRLSLTPEPKRNHQVHGDRHDLGPDDHRRTGGRLDGATAVVRSAVRHARGRCHAAGRRRPR